MAAALSDFGKDLSGALSTPYAPDVERVVQYLVSQGMDATSAYRMAKSSYRSDGRVRSDFHSVPVQKSHWQSVR